MRRYMILAATAAAAAAIVASAVPASAATSDVLTNGKVGGTGVKVGAILKSGLKSGSSAKFTGKSGGKAGVTCKTSSFTAKVTANPKKPGTAKESLTAQTFSKCTASGVNGVKSVKSVTLQNLPNNVTISDASGFPVKVSGTSASKPLKTTITLNTVLGSIKCVYTAKSISGKGSNTGNTITFTNQKFSKSSGPSTCFASGFFSASYGPVTNSSQGNAKVFVN
jgi:hypothetical protein